MKSSVTYLHTSRRHRFALGLTLVILAGAVLAVLTTPRANAGSDVVHLINRIPEQEAREETIKGTTKRILLPTTAELKIPLDAAPPLPLLRFSIGLRPGKWNATIHFRASIRFADGSSKQIYDRKVASPGWYDEQYDLGGVDLDGAVLVLQKSSDGNMRRGVWAEPILLPTEPTERTSVVLISLDTLRADRVGAYNPSVTTTPALDDFAKTAVVYENAYSPSTWTLPSHFSMLRGVPASAGPQRGSDIQDHNGDYPTPLASIFRDAGYLTAGFTGGGYVSSHFGFAEGFDTYYSHQLGNSAAEHCSPDRFDGPEVMRQTKQWLRENGERPFFLFVHTYDAHDRCPLQGPGRGPRKWDSSAEGRRRMSEYYDTVIAKADEVLGGVLAEIDSLRSKRQIVVAVTSDHGEALWEHGYFGHSCRLKPYEPLTRVPLVVRLPSKGAGQRVETPVSVGSIAPTLLELAGLPKAASMTEPMLPVPGSNADDEKHPVYVSCQGRLGIRNGRYKLVTARKQSYLNEVYDLKKDPGEIDNLAPKQPQIAAKLNELATGYWSQSPAAERTPSRKARFLDDTTRERLKALGYLE